MLSLSLLLFDIMSCQTFVLLKLTQIISYFRVLGENAHKEGSEKLTVLVSLSPQAVLSIAAKHSLAADECAQKLASRLKET